MNKPPHIITTLPNRVLYKATLSFEYEYEEA